MFFLFFFLFLCVLCLLPPWQNKVYNYEYSALALRNKINGYIVCFVYTYAVIFTCMHCHNNEVAVEV